MADAHTLSVTVDMCWTDDESAPDPDSYADGSATHLELTAKNMRQIEQQYPGTTVQLVQLVGPAGGWPTITITGERQAVIDALLGAFFDSATLDELLPEITNA